MAGSNGGQGLAASAQTRFFDRHKRTFMFVTMLLVDAVSLLLAAWLAVLIRSLFSPELTDPALYYALFPSSSCWQIFSPVFTLATVSHLMRNCAAPLTRSALS